MATSKEQQLRRVRLVKGMTQDELARRAGISRQALSAIESGSYQPGVRVALALAHELGESVEALFGAPASPAHVDAVWMGGDTSSQHRATPAAPRRAVALGRVGGRLVALSQPPPTLRLASAAGVLEHAKGRRARVAVFRSGAEIEATLMVAGCDPAVAVLGDFLGRSGSGISLAPLGSTSRVALSALLSGGVHAAGVHLGDRKGGEYNLAAVKEVVGRRRAIMVNFASWELGLSVRRGNPMRIESIADLAETGARIANREPGSGARRVLDQALKELKIASHSIAGYEREFSGHLEVAAAVAAGDADAVLTLRVAAEAWGLGFVPVRAERYDLVILDRETGSAPVKALLDALNSSRFANELAALSGYDTGSTGRVIARLNA
jgi:putative molybdopterin biosynthesis protein